MANVVVIECPVCEIELEFDDPRERHPADCSACHATLYLAHGKAGWDIAEYEEAQPASGSSGQEERSGSSENDDDVERGARLSDSGVASIRLAPGTVFAGDFRIVRLLAEGGMGVVYVATQMSTGRERALKLLLPRLARDRRFRKRFVQEARIGARIESDHVVEVIAAGVDDDTGIPFLAMELLEGRNLAEHVAEHGAIPVSEVSALAEQICHALKAAHAAGVVHRDLKPENIFLAERQRARADVELKVLDLGVAKVLAEARTATTAAIGTPLCMAPEQTDADGEVGPHTDVWALGLILFWMLTGRHYWRAASSENQNISAFMREILVDDLPAASRRAADLGVTTALPEGFDAWFKRCVARDIEHRFDAVADAESVLVEVLSGRRVARTQPMAPALARGKEQADRSRGKRDKRKKDKNRGKDSSPPPKVIVAARTEPMTKAPIPPRKDRKKRGSETGDSRHAETIRIRRSSAEGRSSGPQTHDKTWAYLGIGALLVGAFLFIAMKDRMPKTESQSATTSPARDEEAAAPQPEGPQPVPLADTEYHSKVLERNMKQWWKKGVIEKGATDAACHRVELRRKDAINWSGKLVGTIQAGSVAVTVNCAVLAKVEVIGGDPKYSWHMREKDPCFTTAGRYLGPYIPSYYGSW